MEELFTEYTKAFDAFDPNAIASLYHIPCAIADADGVQTFSTRAGLVKKFAANCESMRTIGYQHAQFNILQQQPLGQDKIAITIGWRININDSNVDFRTLYICHLVESEWLVFSAHVYQGSFGNAT